jgi:hypothetical protein
MTTDDTRAKSKLITYLKKQYPELEDKDIPQVLDGIRRFATVINKIFSEPQARISLHMVTENGEKIKKRMLDTDLEELIKIKRAPDEPITVDTFRQLHKKLTEKLKK